MCLSYTVWSLRGTYTTWEEHTYDVPKDFFHSPNECYCHCSCVCVWCRGMMWSMNVNYNSIRKQFMPSTYCMRNERAYKNDLHLKCFVIDYLHISYTSRICYNGIHSYGHNLLAFYRYSNEERRILRASVYFSFYCCMPRTITFSSHTRITSIDSRKPSTINYVKNVCKENG